MDRSDLGGPNPSLKLNWNGVLSSFAMNLQTSCLAIKERTRSQRSGGKEREEVENDRFWMHVIYKNLEEFPGTYVARHLSPNDDGTILVATGCIIAATLEGARETLGNIYPGLYRIERRPDDDPGVVESWV